MPVSLVMGRGGSAVMLGWLVALVGLVTLGVGLSAPSLPALLLGPVVLVLGLWLARRALLRHYRAYRHLLGARR